MSSPKGRAVLAFGLILLLVVGWALDFPTWVFVVFAVLVVLWSVLDLFSHQPGQKPLIALRKALGGIQFVLRFPLTEAAAQAKLAANVDDIEEQAGLARRLNAAEQQVESSDDDPPAEVKASPPHDQSDAEKARIKILGYAETIAKAVLSTAGIAGFVAVAGAAFLWERFYAVKVPAEQAVQAVPNDQLIVFGGVALVVAAVAASTAVAIGYAVNPLGTITPGSILAVGLLVGVGVYASTEIGPRGESPETWEVAALIVLAVFLGLGCLGVADWSGVRFIPFGAAIFLSTLLFVMVGSVVVSSVAKEVQPAALSQPCEGIQVNGFYVADDANHIWLAFPYPAEQVDGSSKPNERAAIRQFDRAEDTELLIGSSVERSQAIEDAKALSRVLIAQDTAVDPEASKRAAEQCAGASSAK